VVFNVNCVDFSAEKKDELQRVGHVEARIQRMLTAIKSTKQNIASCLRTGNKEEQLEKRKVCIMTHMHIYLFAAKTRRTPSSHRFACRRKRT
jgi:hypothetical protein